MEFVIVLLVLGAVVLLVSWPLRRPRDATTEPSGPAFSASVELAELEAAREAKYREIRDAELDHRTGKLSDADYEAIDRGLRAEAVEILHALDRASAAKPDSSSYHRP
jgi:hypothetical protein